MKRLAVIGSMILCAGVLPAQPPPGDHGPRGFGGPMGIMAAGPGSRTPVTGAPYSAVETVQMQQTLADGNQITHQQSSKVYRDSSGRVRIEHTVTPPGETAAKTIVTIFDPVASVSYRLDPANQTAIKSNLPTAHTRSASWAGTDSKNRTAGAAPRFRSQGQRQTDSLGTQAIGGISAAGSRMTETIAAGAIGNQQAIQTVRETWISDDLKVPLMIKSNDPRFGNTVMQLTNITRAEPDAALFQVPSTYTVTAATHGFGGSDGGEGMMRHRNR
jgi:hypothetical protein